MADSCTAIKVPRYERQEMENCLSYYVQEKWISKGETVRPSLLLHPIVILM